MDYKSCVGHALAWSQALNSYLLSGLRVRKGGGFLNLHPQEWMRPRRPGQTLIGHRR